MPHRPPGCGCVRPAVHSGSSSPGSLGAVAPSPCFPTPVRSAAHVHLLLQEPLLLHSLIQRQANPLSFCLRDDKLLHRRDQAHDEQKYRPSTGPRRSKKYKPKPHLVPVVDGCPLLGVVWVQLGVLAGKPQQHPSLQVHPELGAQVLLRSLAGGYAWGQVLLAGPCPPYPPADPTRLLLSSWRAPGHHRTKEGLRARKEAAMLPGTPFIFH